MTVTTSGRAPTWLIDSSAYVRLGESSAAETWVERIDRGLVRISSVTRLELGYAARSPDDLRSQLRGALMAAMPVHYLTPSIEDRAIEVQLLLAERGQHRAPSVSDLLVAAAAELAGFTVLHVDKDFELIAATTGQPLERLATKGDGRTTNQRPNPMAPDDTVEA